MRSNQNLLSNMPNRLSKSFLIALMSASLMLTVGCSTPRTKPAGVIDRSGGSYEPAPPGYYRVKKGDTLARIALDHGQAPRDVAQWNKAFVFLGPLKAKLPVNSMKPIKVSISLVRLVNRY